MVHDCGMAMSNEEGYETCDETFESLIDVHRHRHEEHGEWLPAFAREDDE